MVLHLHLNAKNSMQITVQCEVINVMKLAAIRHNDSIFWSRKLEKVLSDKEVAQLCQFYQQLYPCTPIQIYSIFYTKSKEIALVNDLSKAGSTTMAYWGGVEDL